MPFRWPRRVTTLRRPPQAAAPEASVTETDAPRRRSRHIGRIHHRLPPKPTGRLAPNSATSATWPRIISSVAVRSPGRGGEGHSSGQDSWNIHGNVATGSFPSFNGKRGGRGWRCDRCGGDGRWIGHWIPADSQTSITTLSMILSVGFHRLPSFNRKIERCVCVCVCVCVCLRRSMALASLRSKLASETPTGAGL